MRRRVVNEELRERVHKRFVGMYSLLLSKHAQPAALKGTPADESGAAITAARAREMAADYACSNREARRRNFGERGDGAKGSLAIPKTRKRGKR